MKNSPFPIIRFLLVYITALSFWGCKEKNESFKSEASVEYFTPPVSYEDAVGKADSLLKIMSLEEKIEMIGGHDIFFTKGYEKYGIPSIRFSDASQGVSLIDYTDHLERSVAFPAPIALASTWNVELSGKFAESIGEECRAGGISVLLGPGMNIYRISQCGRNFEYFGEDPFLASRIVENYVLGLQSTGTIATLKHFVANNTDHRRRTSNSIVGERVLHEIYMPAFEAGIDAGAMAIMTSYNLVNGEYAPQSGYVVNRLLREGLGFKWLIMSDWLSVWSAEKALTSGVDLDMPGETEDGIYHEDDPEEYLRREAPFLINDGKISEKDIDRMVRNILATIFAMQLPDHSVKETAYLNNYDRHIEVALETAREGIVLLKNENNTLPFSALDDDLILLTGAYGDTLATGGGAAYLRGFDHVTLLDALQAQYGEHVQYIQEPEPESIKNASLVIFATGTYDSEGSDVPFDLPEETNGAINAIAKLNENTVVVMYTGGGKNLSHWNDNVASILYSWYPGQTGNHALAEIISGKTNPSGKLPITIERDFQDSPGHSYLPEGEELYSDWEYDFDMDHPVYDIDYSEGIFVGYRWYERQQIKPLYPFGFGLSYSTFEYSDLATNAEKYMAGYTVKVKVSIKNTSDVKGKEIVQLYVSDLESVVERPLKELKDFQKIELDAGEERTIYFNLSGRDFAYWDQKWKVDPGEFEIRVGSSSADLHLHTRITIR